MGNMALIPTFMWILFTVSTLQKNVDFIFINTSFNDVLVIFKYICHVHFEWTDSLLSVCAPSFISLESTGGDDDTILSWKIACVIFTEKLGYISDSIMLLQQKHFKREKYLKKKVVCLMEQLCSTFSQRNQF